MKPSQKTSEASAKKPQQHSQNAVLASGPGPSSATKPVYDSPSEAVLHRYIDSRLKQFGTR